MAISKVTTSNTNTINKVTVTDGDAISIITVGTQGLAGAATLLGRTTEEETVGSSDAGSTIIYDHANARWLATTSSNATSLNTKLAGLVFTAGGATVTGVLDEDNLGSDSNTKLATQQSIKAYVDAQITAQDFDFQGDTGGALSIDLDSETMTFTGGTGIDTTGSGNTVTFAIDSTVATLSGSQTLSNKTLTAPVLNTVDINGGDISSGTTINKSPSITLAGDLSGSVTLSNLADGTLTATIAANSVALGTDTTGNYLATLAAANSGIDVANSGSESAAVTVGLNTEYVQDIVGAMFSSNTETGIAVTYVDDDGTIDLVIGSGVITNDMLAGSIANGKLANSSITVTDGSNSTATALGGTITFAAGEGLDVAESSGTVTFSAEDATDSNKGVASFDSTDFSVSSGAVTLVVERISDIVGSMVTSNTESGITVTYQDGDNTLDFDVGDFDIALTGDITGSGTVTNLGNVSIATTVAANSVALGTDTTGNYLLDIAVGEGLDVSHSQGEGSTATISAELATETNAGVATFDGTDFTVSSGDVTLNAERIQDIVGAMVGSNTESGIAVTYEDGDGTLDFNVNDPTITIDGDVDGSATMTNLGNTTITTTLDTVNSNVGSFGSATAIPAITVNAKGLVTAVTTNNIATSFTLAADSGSNDTFNTGETLTFTGTSNEITTTVSNNAITFALPDDVTIGNDLTVTGDLTVNGDTVTLNTATLDVEDATIRVAKGATSLANTNGAGIEFGASSSKPTLTWDNSNSRLTSNKTFHAASLIGALTGNASTATALETARTIHGVSFDGTANIDLSEVISDTVGAMFSSNTETGITATYQDSDNTIDLVVGTLNQDTTGNAATATALETARTIGGTSFDGTANIAIALAATATALANARTIHGVSFDGTANIDLTEVIQDTVGGMFSSNTETGITVTYEDSDGTIDLVVGTLNQDTTGNAATATALETARTIHGVSFDGTANIDLSEVISDTVGAMFSSNTETGITVTYQDSDNTIDLVVGTLNQDTTGNAATATALETARTIHGVSFDGSANIDLSEVISDTVGAMFSSNTETGVTVTYQDADNTIDVVVDTSALTETLTNKTLTSPVINTGVSGTAIKDEDNMASDSATHLATQQSIKAYVDATAQTTEEVQDIVGAMFSSNTETGITVTYEDGDGTIDLVVGTLNQDTTGTAALATEVTVSANNTGNEDIFPVFVDGATGSQGLETDTGLTYNPSTGLLTATGFSGNLTGTLQTAAQTNITSVGTLSALTVSGDVAIDTNVLKVDTSNNRVGIKQASPTVSLDIGQATDAILLPVGTTAQRPSGAAGQFRYNSTLGRFEGYTDAWGEVGGGGTSTLSVNTFTANGSTTAFTLSQAPASEDNILVFVEGVFMNANDFTLSGTTLTLDAAPPNGRKITVYHVTAAVAGTGLTQDSFTGNGSTTAYTLSVAPVSENNTQVYIDGVYQNKATYSTSGTTLTFDAAPANSAAIEAITFTQTNINNFPASGISDLTQVTPVAGDFMMILDATDSALKKSDVKDVMRTAVAIDSSADAVALTFDADENATFAGNIVKGNLTISGTEIDLSSGDLTLDVAGDIILDADGGDFRFNDGGTQFGIIFKSSNDLALFANIQDGDLLFRGNDGGTNFTALQLDMSDAGTAIFNHDITLPDSGKAVFGAGSDLQLFHDGTNSFITNGTGILLQRADDIRLQNAAGSEVMIDATANGAVNLYHDGSSKLATTSSGIQVTGNIANTSGDFTLDVAGDIILDADDKQIFFKDNGTTVGTLSMTDSNLKFISNVNDKDMIFAGTDNNSEITALTLDMSAAGEATFNGGIVSNAGVVVDNITIDGTEIDLSSGDLTLDVAGEIRLSADDNGEVHFYDGSLHYGSILEENSNLIIQSIVQDEDIIFKGDDGGSVITALTLDMSKAGAATFNAGGEFGGDVNIFGTNRLINIGESGSGGAFGFLGWNDASNYLYLGNSYNSAYNTNIVIDSSGNVGIGTASPASKLHLENTASNAVVQVGFENDAQEWRLGVHGGISDGFILYDNTNAASRFFVGTNGNVGIGTTSPAFTNGSGLEIEKDGIATLRLTDTGSSGKVFEIYVDDATGNHLKGLSSGLPMIFSVINDEAMRITTAKSVCIGGTANTGVGKGGLRLTYGSGESDGNYFFVGQGGASNAVSVLMEVVQATGYATTTAAMKVGKHTGNNRSINAGGTVNASGADYAEYMLKSDSCGDIAKGDVVGVDSDGKLTKKFSEANSFVIKSTDPSYVGGDTWWTESEPEPKFTDDTKTTKTDDFKDWEKRMEAARVNVDRIAFSGQVPVNITGSFNVGDYVYPQKNGTGIQAVAKSTPTFEEYQLCVGKIWTTMEDGRPLVAVKIG